MSLEDHNQKGMKSKRCSLFPVVIENGLFLRKGVEKKRPEEGSQMDSTAAAVKMNNCESAIRVEQRLYNKASAKLKEMYRNKKFQLDSPDRAPILGRRLLPARGRRRAPARYVFAALVAMSLTCHLTQATSSPASQSEPTSSLNSPSSAPTSGSASISPASSQAKSQPSPVASLATSVLLSALESAAESSQPSSEPIEASAEPAPGATSPQKSMMASLSSAVAQAAAKAAVEAAKQGLSGGDARSLLTSGQRRNPAQGQHPQRSPGLNLALKLADTIPEVPYNILHNMKKIDHAAPFYNVPNRMSGATKESSSHNYLASALSASGGLGGAADQISALLKSPLWKRIADGYGEFTSEFRSLFRAPATPMKGSSGTASRLLRDLSVPALLMLFASTMPSEVSR